MTGMIAIAFVQSAAFCGLLNAGVQHAGEKALVKALVEVADRPQLVPDPAFLHALLKFLQDVEGEIIFRHGLISGFGGQHATLDGKMNPFQPLRVEESSRVSQDHPAVAGDRRYAPPASIGEGLGAIADHFTSLKELRDKGVLLECL